MMRFALPFCFLGLALASSTSTLLDRGYREMYNLDFEAAHRTFRECQLMNAEDPMGPVSDAAAYLFSELERLHILQSELFVDNSSFLSRNNAKPDAQVKARFEAALEQSRVLADRILRHSPQDPDATFAAILRLGLHSDYLALVEKRYLAALKEMKQGRSMAERLLAAHPDYADAYLAIGVENYLLSLKPAPLRWLLRLGGARVDRETGLAQLRITAARGRYLRPYARLLLAVAALRDRDRQRARQQLTWLAGEFPRNHLYSEELAKLQEPAN